MEKIYAAVTTEGAEPDYYVRTDDLARLARLAAPARIFAVGEGTELAAPWPELVYSIEAAFL